MKQEESGAEPDARKTAREDKRVRMGDRIQIVIIKR